MSRVKNFDATGLAPGGKLYAGDLNAIQDHYADLSNFAQTHDVGTLRVADSSLQILKFGTSEFRLTGAGRFDGLLRGLGGLYAGQFTTATRPGSGLRPYGIEIFNTDLSRKEINIGTDGSPNWRPALLDVDVIQIPIGGSIEYAGAGDFSATLVLEDGRELNRTTYAILFGIISTTYGPGNGTTTFNIPDSRGNVTVGPDDMGTARGAANRIPNSLRLRGQMSGEELHAITIAELAIHNHGGATAGGTSGGQSVDHSHSGTTAAVGDHTHPLSQQILGYPSGTQASNNILFIIGAGGLYNTGASMTPAGAHSHSFSTGGASTGHTHSVPALAISSQGSGTAHNTMQPYVVKNKLIRIA